MRRLLDHWWVVGSGLVLAVIVLTFALYLGESGRQHQQQRGLQRQVVTELNQSVDDVLAREVALARVVGTVPGSIAGRWPVLSNIVMSQPLANSTGFIQPVPQRDRRRFEHQTGLRLLESPKPGELRVASREPLHLVLTAYRQVGPGPPPLGLDIGANALRRGLLLEAERTGRQVATPPIEFLGRSQPTRGVAVYVAVRDARGRLKGWVSAAYSARQLVSTVTARMPGVHLTIRDGASTLVSDQAATGGRTATIDVAGRRWSVWAAVPESGISAVPWLVLGFGLALAAAMMLILRQSATRARDSTQQLALRDADEAAIGQIATLVAQAATPDAVFTSVAEQIVKLFGSRTGAVSRFDAASNQGIVVGGCTRDGEDLVGVAYALEGVSASAEVFRTGRGSRIDGAYESSTDPISSVMSGLGSQAGVAAPIVVAGSLWGALGAAYDEHVIPAGVELRLERFASLIGLAISNADAWDRLARQASTDPLTGMANRRAFDERLSAESARAHRYERSLSLVLLDLDHFKAVNDLYGHPAGDRVLVLFAQLLSAHAREGELVARVGGEEFAWLMPETDEQGAYTAADRVRQALENAAFGESGKVTLSAGVCSSDSALDADALSRNADRALYAAKEGGRNMTFRYSEARPAAVTEEPATALSE